MKVIAVLNQKGGSGKTTIATHLARALQLDGADVLLVDSDATSRRDLATLLRQQQFQLEEAACGADALAVLRVRHGRHRLPAGHLGSAAASGGAGSR